MSRRWPRKPRPISRPIASTAWIPDRPTGDDFLPPLSGPGPVMSAKDHPYVPNGRGNQPTYRVADLSNPILRPSLIENMKKANDDLRAGRNSSIQQHASLTAKR